MNGHQFFEHRLFNIMKCAYCGDFLVKSGFRCDGKFIYLLLLFCSLGILCFFVRLFLKQTLTLLFIFIDCSYSCHARCSGKVVTKCISKSSLDTNVSI